MLTCSCFANNTHTPVIIAKQTLTSSAPDLDRVGVMPAGGLQPQSDSYICPLSKILKVILTLTPFPSLLWRRGAWTGPICLAWGHWARPHRAQMGITHSVLLFPSAVPSSLVHSQLLSWQQWQAGDSGSFIVTPVSTQRTHKGGSGYTKGCFTLCYQTEFIWTVPLLYLHPIIDDGPARKRSDFTCGVTKPLWRGNTD